MQRKIRPYGLCCKHNNWYLVGFCCNTEAEKTFRIDCINHVYISNENFKYPTDFDLNQFFGESWGVFSNDETRDIVIKVNPELAYRFKLIAYHPSQKIVEEFDDGSIVVAYRASGMFEFTGWLLQWAQFVEILEPIDIRQQMRRKLKEMMEMYV